MIELGDLVKDTISDFEGIVTAKVTYLFGCNRVGVTPKVLKDGKKQDAEFFDEPQLMVLKKSYYVRPSEKKYPLAPTG